MIETTTKLMQWELQKCQYSKYNKQKNDNYDCCYITATAVVAAIADDHVDDVILQQI